MIHAIEHWFQTNSTFTIVWVLFLVIVFGIPLVVYPITMLVAGAVGAVGRLVGQLPANKRKREWQKYGSEQFVSKVDLWRERAAKAREKLPSGASGDEVMAQARAEVDAAEER
jgi:hypothetical protein